MTSFIEKLVAIIAPHHCIVCGSEDNILCDSCIAAEYICMVPICCVCAKPSKDWALCRSCGRATGLDHIWAAGEYRGIFEKTIGMLKFERAQAAAMPLSKIMATALPYNDWLVVPVPTASARVRQRGYDQACLLARELARLRTLAYSPVLIRVQNVRQVGANRVQRLQQSAKMFSTRPGVDVRGAKILLVDDVCTTGATLSAAARVLRAAGAVSVDAVVAAWQPPKR